MGYILAMWLCVCTSYGCVCRWASCVKLYVSGHLGCLHRAVGSFTVSHCSSPLQTSTVAPPQPHCHHNLCALFLSLIPFVTFGCPMEVLSCWGFHTSHSPFLWLLGTGCPIEEDSLVVHRVCSLSWELLLQCMCGEWATWIRWVETSSFHTTMTLCLKRPAVHVWWVTSCCWGTGFSQVYCKLCHLIGWLMLLQ